MKRGMRMLYIYANYVDFERITSYLECNNEEYICEENTIELYSNPSEVTIQVVFQYLDVSDVEMVDDEMEEEFEQPKVIIEELTIKPKNLFEHYVDENMITKILLERAEIRQGMILKKTLPSGKELFFIVTTSNLSNQQCELYEVQENENVGYMKVEYEIGKDLDIFGEVLKANGVVDLGMRYAEETFEDYTFVGYARSGYFFELMNIVNEEDMIGNEVFEIEFPYDFMKSQDVFEEVYGKLQKIPFYASNRFEAIQIFLKKIYFPKVTVSFVFVLALAVETKNNDILDLVKMVKSKYEKIDEEELIGKIIDDYESFLSINFYNHFDMKNLSINDFIAFIITRF